MFGQDHEDPIALLLGVSVILARAADLAERGNPTALDLADIACAAAGQRLDGLWSSQLATDTGRPGADPAALGDTWLRSTDLDFPHHRHRQRRPLQRLEPIMNTTAEPTLGGPAR